MESEKEFLKNYNADEVAKIVIEEGVKAVTTGAGNPSKYIAAWKEAGVKVMPVVASVAMAKMMERAGADCVVAEGMESGGHIGSITTMCLLPQVADAVSIPVIGAGGIADGRGLAAAKMLGAEAVQMGTAFLVAKENIVHENFRNKVINAKDIDSVVTGTSTGHPVRSIRNKMTKEYLKLESQGVELMELEKLTLGSLRRAVIDGDDKTGTLMAGQIAGLIKEEKSCKDIIEQIIIVTKLLRVVYFLMEWQKRPEKQMVSSNECGEMIMVLGRRKGQRRLCSNAWIACGTV